MEYDIEFNAIDKFNITNKGLVLEGKPFDGYKNSIGKIVKATGKANGFYRIIDVEKFFICFSEYYSDKIGLLVVPVDEE